MDDVQENMKHYIELLATNLPWHLLIFMAIPVILADGCDFRVLPAVQAVLSLQGH
jgi:hypothetical protein